ncbi:hypothetical protein [Streptomyces triticirhizae]|uniref:Uncharacterized protein n=1 Tax=Streptomyces triticirhizae TaxID=2483353 RepID=A0A3M2M0U7_9ACTN|nr:hypothetical protein [Streptomyces triticirhizae]RMI43217.1 hypothetical protein EBN88_07760 [Streptomyces triticirhizae]
MARDITRHLTEALDAWQRARNLREAGRTTRAGMVYQRGINAFLLHRTLLRRAESEAGSAPRTDLTPVLFALGAVTREGVPVIEAARSRRFATLHARTGLAAAHLADPSRGVPESIGPTLSGPPERLPRVAPGDEAPVPADERIAGAASSRLLMARLMAEYPAVLARERRRWTVTDEEPLPFVRERRRFRGAVLPGCVGLDHRAETRRLAGDGVRIYTELTRVLPVYRPALDRARDDLAAVQARLGEG